MPNAGLFPTPRESRLEQAISQLSEFVDPSYNGWTRLAFSDEYIRARLWLKVQMESAGLHTYVDAAANHIGRLEGNNAALPPLVIGSHIDTVRPMFQP
jgi:N-carbamoyl-L-amino-acid hydrolase